MMYLSTLQCDRRIPVCSRQLRKKIKSFVRPFHCRLLLTVGLNSRTPDPITGDSRSLVVLLYFYFFSFTSVLGRTRQTKLASALRNVLVYTICTLVFDLVQFDYNT